MFIVNFCIIFNFRFIVLRAFKFASFGLFIIFSKNIYTILYINILINIINFNFIFYIVLSSNTMSKKLADKLHIGIELEHESYSTVANSNKILKYGYIQKIVTIKKMNILINFTIS